MRQKIKNKNKKKNIGILNKVYEDFKNKQKIKEKKEIKFAKELGKKVGEDLKFQSKGSYKR